MQGKKKLAVAMTAMSIAAAGGGIGAAGAQAQGDEVLAATATTISGGANGLCFSRSLAANATFNAAGSATGPNGVPAPYPGQFTETKANASLSGSMWPLPVHLNLTLSIPFTISSGTTTITGTITNPSPYAGGNPVCGTGWSIWGVGVGASGAKYKATIQRPRRPAQTVSGTPEGRSRPSRADQPRQPSVAHTAARGSPKQSTNERHQ